jgi:hypothetical protein
LKAVVPAEYLSNDGNARVTVVNPGPGGGSSDPVPFTITVPPSSLVFRAFPVEGMGITSPINAVTADFNNDGIADLAVVDQAPAPSCDYRFHGDGGIPYNGVGSIAILPGNGDGTFSSRSSALCFVNWLETTPQKLVMAADLNRDGNVDLIAVSSGYFGGEGYNIGLYLGNGDGTFAALHEVWSHASWLDPQLRGAALGDFQSDGQLNLAVSEATDDYADVFLLPGHGFLLYSGPGLMLGAGPLISGDFNGDGVLDLADGAGILFLNKGNGVFTKLNMTGFGASTVSGDFNGDGILDLATVNGNTISILLGKGDGTFTAKTGQPVSAQTNVSLIGADINGDGKLDLVAIDSTNAVSIWLGNGDGTFQAPRDSTGRGDSVVATDFNGDGRMDLAVTNSVNGTVSILLQGPPYKALVESPINADGTSVFSAKRGVVPVKFTLTENGVPTCTMPPATIALTRTAGGTLGSVDDSVYANPSDKGSNFRIDRSACQYVYNLATRSLGIGRYRTDISINGYVVGHAVFALQ